MACNNVHSQDRWDMKILSNSKSVPVLLNHVAPILLVNLAATVLQMLPLNININVDTQKVKNTSDFEAKQWCQIVKLLLCCHSLAQMMFFHLKTKMSVLPHIELFCSTQKALQTDNRRCGPEVTKSWTNLMVVGERIIGKVRKEHEGLLIQLWLQMTTKQSSWQWCQLAIVHILLTEWRHFFLGAQSWVQVGLRCINVSCLLRCMCLQICQEAVESSTWSVASNSLLLIANVKSKWEKAKAFVIDWAVLLLSVVFFSSMFVICRSGSQKDRITGCATRQS